MAKGNRKGKQIEVREKQIKELLNLIDISETVEEVELLLLDATVDGIMTKEVKHLARRKVNDLSSKEKVKSTDSRNDNHSEVEITIEENQDSTFSEEDATIDVVEQLERIEEEEKTEEEIETLLKEFEDLDLPNKLVEFIRSNPDFAPLDPEYMCPTANYGTWKIWLEMTRDICSTRTEEYKDNRIAKFTEAHIAYVNKK